MFIIPIKIIKFNKKERLRKNWNRLETVCPVDIETNKQKTTQRFQFHQEQKKNTKGFGSLIKQCVLNLGFSTPKKYPMWTFKGIFKTTAVFCINSSLQQQPPFNFTFLFTVPGKKHTQTNPTMLLSPPSRSSTRHHRTHPRLLNSHYSWHTDHLHAWWKY